MTAEATKLDGAITRSPRAREFAQSARKREPGGTSGSVVTSQTAICEAAKWAHHAPPALCACTMSTRAPAISSSSWRALRLSLNGLKVSFASGTHSPPKALSSSDSGPSSAATTARAPHCSSAWATLRAVRATGPSRNAGTICRTVAPAKVRTASFVSP